MKRNYARPSLTLSGGVVYQTQSGLQPGNELAQPLIKFNMTED